jgi:hypothetical protein
MRESERKIFYVDVDFPVRIICDSNNGRKLFIARRTNTHTKRLFSRLVSSGLLIVRRGGKEADIIPDCHTMFDYRLEWRAASGLRQTMSQNGLSHDVIWATRRVGLQRDGLLLATHRFSLHPHLALTRLMVQFPQPARNTKSIDKEKAKKKLYAPASTFTSLFISSSVIQQSLRYRLSRER